VARRLTDRQKLDIVDGYRLGESSANLANQFSCSVNTVIRIVKGAIQKDEYEKLKSLREKGKYLKSTNEGSNRLRENQKELSKDQNINQSNNNKNFSLEELTQSLSDDVDESGVNVTQLGEEDSQQSENTLVEKNIKKSAKIETYLNKSEESDTLVFKEVAPLVQDFGFENRIQKVACKPLKDDSLPQVVYMLVDKKVELESIMIRDLPEWSFLPDKEKDQKVISLFDNQREAKRNCSRNQRVIKVPDSRVFLVSRDFILSKGITRLVLDNTLISLEEDH
tara:strand:+ start:467 stop:1306 length:840 start_codon:yes stop_codon:yes gene_type:complete